MATGKQMVETGVGITMAVVITLIIATMVMPIAIDAIATSDTTETTETLEVAEGGTEYLENDQGFEGYEVNETEEEAEFNTTDSKFNFGFSGAPTNDSATVEEEINGTDYVITWQGYADENTGILDVEYEEENGAFGPAEAALFGILPLIAVLVLFLTMIGWAVSAYRNS